MHIFLTSSAAPVVVKIGSELHTQKRQLKLAFIFTASEVKVGSKSWLKADRDALVAAGFVVEDYTVTGKTAAQIEADLLAYDVLYFSGGNTFYLLQQLQQTGGFAVVRRLVQEEGKIYIGTSAGSIVAGPDIAPARNLDAMAQAPDLKGTRGLELVDFVVFPHWGSEHFRELYLGDEDGEEVREVGDVDEAGQGKKKREDTKKVSERSVSNRLTHAYHTGQFPILLLTDTQYVEVKDGWVKLVSKKS
jgi:dipeptidase E